MFQRVGLREEGKPLPLAFHNLILMIKRPCDLNLVMISSLASKCQHFKVGMPIFQPFYVMKLKTSNFKVLAFCSQWRYHDQIQITSFHIIRIKYWNASRSGSPPTLIPALYNIGILLHKQATLGKHFWPECIFVFDALFEKIGNRLCNTW